MASKIEFQHAYSVPFRGSDVECPEPSLTQQQFKDDADINVLLERFKVTGVMPQGVRLPTYGDFTGISDYRTAADAVFRAQNAFMELPAEVRSRFMNSPQLFLEFCSDPKNLDELRKLGLAPAKPDVSGAPAEPVKGAEPPAKPSGVTST